MDCQVPSPSTHAWVLVAGRPGLTDDRGTCGACARRPNPDQDPETHHVTDESALI